MNDRPRALGRLAWLLPLAVLAIALALMPSDGRDPRKVPFSEALTLIEKGSIKRAELQTRDNVFKLWSADDTRYETGYLPDNGSELIAKLQAHQVDIRIEPDKRSPWASVAMFVLPVALLIGFWVLLARRMQGRSGLASFGRAKARRVSADTPKITFRDVAGVDEAVEELHEIKEFLENPKKFQAFGKLADREATKRPTGTPRRPSRSFASTSTSTPTLPGCADSQGRAALWAAGDGQDAVGSRGGG